MGSTIIEAIMREKIQPNSYQICALRIQITYQFSFGEQTCIERFVKMFVKIWNDKVIAIAPCKGNSYKLNFTKVHEVDVPIWCNLQREKTCSNFVIAALII